MSVEDEESQGSRLNPTRAPALCLAGTIGGTLISINRIIIIMVITELPSTLAMPDADFELMARVYKVLANPTRLKMLSTVESRSLSFTELMRTLGLNPKTLSSSLNSMGKCGLVRKSYPHQVYVITPLGRRIIREQLLALQESLQLMPSFERRVD